MPLEAIDYFGEILDTYSDREKAGFGLRIDDIPDIVCQETVYDQRPELILETEFLNGVSALHLASVGDLPGRGEIVRVDIHPVKGTPEHDWITNEFEVDGTDEKFFPTFMANGYLRRGAE